MAIKSSPHKLKLQDELSKLTSDSAADLGVPQASLLQPPTPQPSAGAEVCMPKPASIPIRYFITTAFPPPAETVEVAAFGAVTVKVFVVTAVIS